MVRSATYGYASQASKPRQNVKRRYDLTLNPQGAEIRLPSLPQIGLNWRLFSFLLAAILVFALYQLLTSPMFRVEGIQASGFAYVTDRQIEEVLDLSGKVVFTLNPNQISDALVAAFPEFSGVDVAVELPNKVAISVKERMPVLIWRMSGQSNLVDASGMPFTLRQNITVLDLPVVHAEEFVITKTSPEVVEEEKNKRRKLFSKEPSELPVVPGVEALIPPEMVTAVLELHELAPLEASLIYTVEHGLGWKDRNGWYVYFGNAEDIQVKYAVYKALWERLKAENIKPAFINVAQAHAPYYRLVDE